MLPRYFDAVARSIALQPRLNVRDRVGADRVRAAAQDCRPSVVVGADALPGSLNGVRLLVELLARTYGSIQIETGRDDVKAELVQLAKATNPDIEVTNANPTIQFVWGDHPHAGPVIC